jgi:hypothetical protein
MLVGREQERQRLGVLPQQARSAVSATCVVRGEAGIGKSAMLDDVMADAEGWEVLRARGVVTESELARSPGFLDQSPPLVPASWRLEDVFTDELGRLPTRCREVLERARGRDGDRRAGRLPGHQHDPGGGGARSAVAGPAARHPRAGRSAGLALRPRCAAAHGCAASARPVASIPWAPSSCPWSSHSGCSLTGRSRRL